jgi:hypothetical protein
MTVVFETLHVDETNPLAPALKAFAEKSDFFAKLLVDYTHYKYLSPKQWACVEREIAKSAPLKANLFSEIGERLLHARDEHGMKKPAIKLNDGGAGEYRFSLAPPGVNTGYVYVKTQGETEYGYGWVYLGKIHPHTGEVSIWNWDEKKLFLSRMEAVLADGLDAALRDYGLSTGNCGCCGRQLTEDLSVKSGVGPVCATRYNIDRDAIVASIEEKN